MIFLIFFLLLASYLGGNCPIRCRLLILESFFDLTASNECVFSSYQFIFSEHILATSLDRNMTENWSCLATSLSLIAFVSMTFSGNDLRVPIPGIELSIR